MYDCCLKFVGKQDVPVVTFEMEEEHNVGCWVCGRIWCGLTWFFWTSKWPVDSERAPAKSFPLTKYLEKSFLLPSGGAFETLQEGKKCIKKKKGGEKRTVPAQNQRSPKQQAAEPYLWLQLSQGNPGS